MSLRDKIKNCDDIKKEIVHLDTWDCDIEVRTISAKERSNIVSKAMDKDNKIKNDILHSLMIIASCYDPETGEKIFQDGDHEWLLEKSSNPIEKLSASVMRLSGLSKDSMDEAEKN